MPRLVQPQFIYSVIKHSLSARSVPGSGKAEVNQTQALLSVSTQSSQGGETQILKPDPEEHMGL